MINNGDYLSDERVSENGQRVSHPMPELGSIDSSFQSPTPTPTQMQQTLSPFSPRETVVEQLRRAISLREGSSTSGSSSSDSRAGLERSASDAARQHAMAKLTGEKMVS